MEIQSDLLREVVAMEAEFEKLTEDLISYRRTIEEEVWIKRWMRGIMEDPNFPLSAWVVSVAGTASTPVDILKDGEVVATMPPIVAPIGTQRTKYNYRTSTNAISAQVSKDTENFPHTAQQIFYSSLEPLIVAGEYDPKWVTVWEHLRQRYGYSDTPQISSTSTKPSAKGVISSDNDEFEEL